MSGKNLNRIEAQALSYGIKKSLRDGVSHAPVFWHVTCDCGEVGKVPADGNTSPELMVRNMRKRGWDLREGKPPKCPPCVHPKKDPDMSKPGAVIHVAEPIPPSTVPASVSTKITLGVGRLLDEFFDTTAMLYKGGWTDAKVAKEIGTAEGVVTRIRDEVYGKLAEDPEITTLKDDLQLLALELGETFRKFNERLEAFRSRADRLAAGRKV